LKHSFHVNVALELKRPLQARLFRKMTRVPVPERRAKLLDEIVDYILSNGLAGLSLRPLAVGVNASPRMLLYFFGSKEQLMSEALAQIRFRQQADFVRAMAGPGGCQEQLLRAWSAWSSPRMGKFWRFCFGIYGFALQNPKKFAGFLELFIGDWLPPFEQALGAAGFPPERARSLATLSLAAMRGL
jgi:AcrR family transcriptional regulator